MPRDHKVFPDHKVHKVKRVLRERQDHKDRRVSRGGAVCPASPVPPVSSAPVANPVLWVPPVAMAHQGQRVRQEPREHPDRKVCRV